MLHPWLGGRGGALAFFFFWGAYNRGRGRKREEEGRGGGDGGRWGECEEEGGRGRKKKGEEGGRGRLPQSRASEHGHRGNNEVFGGESFWGVMNGTRKRMRVQIASGHTVFHPLRPRFEGVNYGLLVNFGFDTIFNINLGAPQPLFLSSFLSSREVQAPPRGVARLHLARRKKRRKE